MLKDFLIPDEIIDGCYLFKEGKVNFQKFGKKALIVTDAFMKCRIDNLLTTLQQQDIQYCIFSEISQEPTDEIIDTGKQCFDEYRPDFVIGIGGGSVLDSAKVIAIIREDETIEQLSYQEINRTHLPLVLIPTTSGTGSEVTRFAVINDTKTHAKLLLKGNAFMADTVILDYSLTYSMPPSITAMSGFDALCHAIEAYLSKKSYSLSDEYAVDAIKTIITSLPLVYQNGDDSISREQMSIGAMKAGVAFNNASVTLIHGMSRPIGALFHIPHGLVNAMLLEECLRFICSCSNQRLASLSREIDVASIYDNDQTASHKFLKVIHELLEICHIPTLLNYGIDKDEYMKYLEKMTDDAWESGSPQNTIIPLTKADLKQLYKNLIREV